MARTVKWTESTISDLEEVAEFIARDSRFYATAVVREARKADRSDRCQDIGYPGAEVERFLGVTTSV